MKLDLNLFKKDLYCKEDVEIHVLSHTINLNSLISWKVTEKKSSKPLIFSVYGIELSQHQIFNKNSLVKIGLKNPYKIKILLPKNTRLKIKNIHMDEAEMFDGVTVVVEKPLCNPIELCITFEEFHNINFSTEEI